MKIKTVGLRYIILSLLGIPLGVLLFQIFSNWETNVGQMLLRIYGAFPNSGMENMFFLIITLLPLLLQLVVWTSVITNGLNTAAPYIFVRNSSKVTWYLRKVALITLSSILYYALQFATFVVLGLISNKELDDVLVSVLFNLTSYIMINTSLVLLVNVLSLKIKETYALLTVFSCNALLIGIALPLSNLFDGIFIKILPVYQGQLALHTGLEGLDSSNNIRSFFEHSVAGFDMTYSWIYMIVFFSIILLVGRYLFGRKDII